MIRSIKINLNDQELEDKREIPSGGGGSPGDHDSPPPDHGPTTPPPSPSPGRRPTTPPPSPPRSPGGSPGGGSPGGLHPPLFPAEANIPHYSDLKLFTAAEIYPWDPIIVGTVPIIAMIQATLTKRMPIPANFLESLLFGGSPTRGWLLLGVDHRCQRFGSYGYRAVAHAWPASPHSLDLRSQPSSAGAAPLWRIAVAYAALEEVHMIAYWESSHYLEITSVMAAADSDLFTYHQDRRQRRIRAGESWRKLLGDMVVMMMAKWADVDLLLDPYFLHLPTKQDRVRWYPGSVSRAANLAQPTANLPEPTSPSRST
ncbi:LOW QUALITY PROTEIN: hypothetical protein PHMEG_00035701 [Phytophthora megakarya]|uniref:Uncharacterized protein n=1 Tax=Phytophthora megakarya TaxID=4795 RepID=A0A225UPP0_9STRA|nr:LOW QUALITY PROTEIN: hypothetical protein PHMEG_00035701 [Phytophthora megakarya]